MKPSTVLILGASGRFGTAALQAFAGAGWRVWAQMRRRPPAALPADVTAVDTPLSDAAGWARQAAGSSAVVYAVNPAYTRWDAEALPLARQGMDIAQRLGATFMLPGNVYNFGAGMPALLDERTAEQPTTAKGRLRCELEAELAARAGTGLRSVVIRAGDFYGCGRGSWLDLVVVKSLRQGRLVYPGPLEIPHAWAYLPDLARAFVAVAARTEAPAFERLHFAGHTLTGRELLTGIEAAARSLGLVPKDRWRHGTMPWGLLRVLGVLVPTWREVERMSYLWRVPHALDGRALARAVGKLPGTAPQAALRQALVDLGYGAAPGAGVTAHA